MPLKYHPETGLPSYVPDLGEELEEGVTPKPTKITSKSDVFAGDKKADMLAREEGASASTSRARIERPTRPVNRSRPSRSAMKHTAINAGETEHQGAVAMATPDPNSKTPLADALAAGIDISGKVDEAMAEFTSSAKPARLDKDVATDEEVDNLERLAQRAHRCCTGRSCFG